LLLPWTASAIAAIEDDFCVVHLGYAGSYNALVRIVVAAQKFNRSNRALFGLFIRLSDTGRSDNVAV
jgi:hypothetical protein